MKTVLVKMNPTLEIVRYVNASFDVFDNTGFLCIENDKEEIIAIYNKDAWLSVWYREDVIKE